MIIYIVIPSTFILYSIFSVHLYLYYIVLYSQITFEKINLEIQ